MQISKSGPSEVHLYIMEYFFRFTKPNIYSCIKFLMPQRSILTISAFGNEHTVALTRRGILRLVMLQLQTAPDRVPDTIAGLLRSRFLHTFAGILAQKLWK